MHAFGILSLCLSLKKSCILLPRACCEAFSLGPRTVLRSKYSSGQAGHGLGSRGFEI